MIVTSEEMNPSICYRLATSTIVPRPIAWVSSMDAEGNLNLAPFSYFTVVSSDPLTLVFCPQLQGDGRKKDTLRNVETLGEFVINIPSEETAEAMNVTAAAFPPSDSEFDWAGLTPAPSQTIQVPRVAEAAVAYECTLQQVVTVGSGAAVFGEVQCIHVQDDLYDGNYVNLAALRPIGRLAGSGYTRVTDLFEMERISDLTQLQRR